MTAESEPPTAFSRRVIAEINVHPGLVQILACGHIVWDSPYVWGGRQTRSCAACRHREDRHWIESRGKRRIVIEPGWRVILRDAEPRHLTRHGFDAHALHLEASA